MPPKTTRTRRRSATPEEVTPDPEQPTPSTDVVPAGTTDMVAVAQLIEEGRKTLTSIVRAENKNADAYNKLADTLINLRRHFQSPGRDFPDWRGRSQAYREAAAQVYAEAEIPPDSETAIQARIRYVIGLRIREVAPAEQLDELGYKKRNAVEAARDRRAQGRRGRQPLDTEGPTLQAAPQGPPITTRAEAFRAVRRVVEEVVWELPIPEEQDEEAYVDLMRELVETAKLFEQLWALHEKRRSDRRHTIEVASTYAATRVQRPATPAEAAAIRANASAEARFLSAPRPEPVAELEAVTP